MDGAVEILYRSVLHSWLTRSPGVPAQITICLRRPGAEEESDVIPSRVYSSLGIAISTSACGGLV